MCIRDSREGGRGDRLFNAAVIGIVIALSVVALRFILTTVGFGEIFKVFGLGLATMARVAVLVAFATIVWTPIGVAIGFNPRLASAFQPVVQFLSSFPVSYTHLDVYKRQYCAYSEYLRDRVQQ